MFNRHVFYWLWAGWIIYFAIIEGIAIYWEIKNKGNDQFTFTHFIASQLPMDIRIALLAWLVYHFIWVHINSWVGRTNYDAATPQPIPTSHQQPAAFWNGQPALSNPWWSGD